MKPITLVLTYMYFTFGTLAMMIGASLAMPLMQAAALAVGIQLVLLVLMLVFLKKRSKRAPQRAVRKQELLAKRSGKAAEPDHEETKPGQTPAPLNEVEVGTDEDMETLPHVLEPEENEAEDEVPLPDQVPTSEETLEKIDEDDIAESSQDELEPDAAAVDSKPLEEELAHSEEGKDLATPLDEEELDESDPDLDTSKP